MTFKLIEDQTEAERLARTLSEERSIALDCEASGFHRYSDQLSLVQLSTPVDSFVLDPFAVDLPPVLGPVLEDPDREVILHGADYDLRLLDRDLGLRVRGLYDTQVAAAFAGESQLGLSALLEKSFDVKLSKKYQKADWASRPLSPEMLDYAASDTRHLHRLAALLRREVEGRGRADWVEEENRALEQLRHEEPPEVDPVGRVKGAKELPPRTLQRVRAGLAWRDELAKRLDRAPFRIASDAALLNVAAAEVDNPGDLARVSGFPRRFAREEGAALVEGLRAADALPESGIEPFPRPPRGGGPGRPTPEEEELGARIREIRNTRAPELELDRGLLFPNHLILAVARARPRTLEALGEIPGIRSWQVALLGRGIIAALA